jgi:hypothetical protein
MLLLSEGGDVDAQVARLAENEALFRDINERVRAIRGETGEGERSGDEFQEFLCECARQDCLEKVRMTLVEYEGVRSMATDFLVVPGHQVADTERVLGENDRFAVVRKQGRAAEIARRRDPRSRP